MGMFLTLQLCLDNSNNANNKWQWLGQNSMPHHWQLATLFGVAHIDTNADAHPHAFMQLVFGSSVVSFSSSSPPSRLCAYIYLPSVQWLWSTCHGGRRQQLKRQRHRLVRGVKLAGILGLRQVQINNDNRHQTADNSHQTTTTSRCCTLCKQRDPQTEDQTQTQSHHRQSEAESKHQIDLSIRWKTAKVAHTFHWHLKVIWIYAATYI